MLKDLDPNKYSRIFIACGYTDLRMGYVRLMDLISYQFKLDPYDKNSLFLFCGRKANTIKAITFEGDGVVVMSKRLMNGHYQWPRTPEEVHQLTYAQFTQLMQGLAVEGTVREYDPASKK